jgi:hypothetical protein
MTLCQKFRRHSGALSNSVYALMESEPGIHNHDREYGFRACAPAGWRRLERIPE